MSKGKYTAVLVGLSTCTGVGDNEKTDKLIVATERKSDMEQLL